MLRELWEYLTTPASPEARRLGYVMECVALGARHRRQRRAWEPHVAEARRFVAEAAARAGGGTALVAGSGWLIEVPLAELSARFREVVLADLVHPLAVRRAARRLGNVRLARVDLAGVMEGLAAGQAPVPPDLGRFDFAVSCNLLSQLPVLPLEALERSGVAEAERAALAWRLVEGHVAWLRRAGRVAALFTDVEAVWLEDGREVEREEALWGAELPPPDQTWEWDIAPRGEQDRRRALRHRVAGWRDLNAAPPDTSI